MEQVLATEFLQVTVFEDDNTLYLSCTRQTNRAGILLW